MKKEILKLSKRTNLRLTDKVLETLYLHPKNTMHHKLLKDTAGIESDELFDRITGKLQRDDLVVYNQHHLTYTITFDGCIFTEEDGYIGKFKRERIAQRRQLWTQIFTGFVAGGTVVAAIYYVIMIGKEYGWWLC